MNRTINLICAFFGGVTMGSLATVAIMKKLGYIKSDEIPLVSDDKDTELASDHDGHPLDEVAMEMDTPSFTAKKKVDTHKTSYHTVMKPDLESVSKKYQDPSFDQHMAEREHPEEDTAFDPRDTMEEIDPEEEVDEDFDEPPAMIEYEEVDGFGHVISELHSSRRDQVIYLIPVEYAGEIYSLESLTYYERDGILCDENDAVVDDVTGLVGEALELFGESGEEYPDLVFVRNCSMGLEYEIERVDEYYAAHVYGVKKEDLEDEGPTRTSKKKAKRQE